MNERQDEQPARAKTVHLSETTAVALDDGQVEVLRSAQRRMQGRRFSLKALARWRRWQR